MDSGRIVLASASPRRRELLARAGLAFEVRPVDVDETLTGFAGELDAARELALRKARAAAAREDPDGPPTWVIGADTVVARHRAGGVELLGKPADEGEARAMLERLSGTRHAVVSGVCVIDCARGAAHLDAERTWVHMRPLAPAEVAAYVASGEWRDKAGGYAIQETADAFVTRLEEGGFDNVVGLPVERTLALLRRAGAPVPPAGPRRDDRRDLVRPPGRG